MPDAGRQMWKMEFQKILSSPRRKIEASKSKTKIMKKELREMKNQRKMKRKRDKYKDNEK